MENKKISLLFKSGGVAWTREVYAGPVTCWSGGESVAGTEDTAAGSVSVHREAGSGKTREKAEIRWANADQPEI